jgi:ABC-2 type transport system permease protein
MAVVSRLLPMTYCVDFMRGVFYGNTGGGVPLLHSPLVNLVVITVFTVIFFAAGTAGFVRAERNR